ncbi:MAG: histidinol-phosphatase HisJ family protein [Clostridia bacterium]|nr:histidinol-phosphatase HisJ family protein [Clostridia bacterium]
MLTNYHTHSTFCDGKSTIEETVLSAIEKGFRVLGFSGHGYTDFDDRYCMQDTEGYIAEVLRVKEKYKDKIEILLGIEEDMRQPVDRGRYDYIIGSSHYSFSGERFYDVDGSPEGFEKGIAAWGDPVSYAEDYYKNFCEYILRRKPDIIGHFDLLTKFDEHLGGGFAAMPEYRKLSLRYAKIAAGAECVFEVNTGAIARGWRTTPYPSEDILHVLKCEDAKIMLNTDCHHADNLTCHRDEALALIKDIGFTELYHLTGGEWVKERI